MVLCQIPTISPSNLGVGEWGMTLIGALVSVEVDLSDESVGVVYVMLDASPLSEVVG